jgi:diguanylate cyclase (GGDEF)-like protein/PAS domain S-box-containing protein/putative nucleotidyltransferase with HDIG domain
MGHGGPPVSGPARPERAGARAARADASAELRLARLRNRHESILQSVGEGIFGLDRDGRATFVNAAAARRLGYAAGELIGEHMHGVMHHSRPDGSPFPAEECPVYEALRDGTVHQVGDEAFWRKDGSPFPVEYTSTPIVEGDEVVGAVVVFSDISERLAAERAQRASEARARAMAAEQAALRRVATAVAADADSEEIFALVAHEVAALMGADVGRVVRFSDAGDDELGGALALVRAGGGAAVWRDADGGRTEVAAPVHLGDALWGAIISSSAGAQVPEDALERLAEFAQLVGLAIANAESRDRIVTEAAAGILQGRLDVGATLQAIAEAAKRALGSDRATCYLNTDDAAAVEAIYTTATDPKVRAFLQGTVGGSHAGMPLWRLLVAEPGVLVIEDAHADPRVPPKLAAKLGAGAFLGIRLEHPTIATPAGDPLLLGTLFVSYSRARRISGRAVTAAASLGGLAALAVANARLHDATLRSLQRAEERAAVDPLTGLANHRTFHEALRSEVGRSRRDGRPLSLALLDLDRFKQLNDAHGHQAGDRVLAEVAARLRALAREGDLVARIGGEEFAWLLPGAYRVEAIAAAERARRAISERPFDTGWVTISGGVCDLAHADGNAERLVELADGALYWAKGEGRDVVVSYSPEVVTDLSAEGRADRLGRVQAMASLRALARAVDAKDHSTLRHSERVAQLAALLAEALGWPARRVSQLREAGLLHDVGKIGVPDAVLFKPERLTPEEYEQVKLHAPLGARIAAEVLSLEQVAWIRHHHERWDGRGYPDGLVGADAPDGARLLALADAWDVMTSARVYKSPVTFQEALAECRRHAGGQFAPDAVEALAGLMERGLIARMEPDLSEAATGGELAGALQPLIDFGELCQDALGELRRAMGWDLAFVTRLLGERLPAGAATDGAGRDLEVIAVAGDRELLAPGDVVPLADSLCHRMLTGRAPGASGRLSDPGSGFCDVPMLAHVSVESYSGHPVTRPDGTVFGTLCAVDRRPRPVDEDGRRLGDVLARLLAGELAREERARPPSPA